MRMWMWYAGCLGLVMLLTGGCAHMCAKRTSGKCSQLKAPIQTGIVPKTVTWNGEEHRYAVYVPPDYNPDHPWPLILFLHGMGERGNDGISQTQQGIGTAIEKFPERFPCIVVMPQCPGDLWWHRAFGLIDAAFNKTLAEYNTDPDRTYLTGLSMGGFGTWVYGAKHTDRFAALIPICGGGNLEDVKALTRVPIWVFHGDADTTVPVDRSRTMVDAIKKAGGDIRYTEYPGVGHNSWDNAYRDPETIKWLLSQVRKH